MRILCHCMSARSFRPLRLLEELGLPYELRMLPFPPRGRRAYRRCHAPDAKPPA